MGVKKEEKHPDDIVAVRVFFRYDNFADISCDGLLVNNITDEIVLFIGDIVVAKFFKSGIAGYIVIREKDGTYARPRCWED